MKKIICLLVLMLAVVICSPSYAAVSKGFKNGLKKETPRVIKKYGQMFTSAGLEFSVPPTVVAGIMMVETQGKCNDHKDSGAKGCMQVKQIALDEVRRFYGKNVSFSDDLNDDYNNIRIAAAYYAALRDNGSYPFNYLEWILVAYKHGQKVAKTMTAEEIFNDEYIEKFSLAQKSIPVLF